MLILGIESSCDETGIALYESEHGLLSQALHSQVSLHADYGGVVPELASRDHVRKITPLTHRVLQDADKTLDDVDGIAYTAGPGLMGALLVGASFAKSLAWSLGIPALGIHHMEAHLLAPLINRQSDALALRLVALLVSGGHTQLVHVRAFGDYEILASPLMTQQVKHSTKRRSSWAWAIRAGQKLLHKPNRATRQDFASPRPMTDRPGLDFSFSGLKTYALNTVQSLDTLSEQDIADVSVAFEIAAVDTLVIKCRRAIEQTGARQLVIAGGVSANTRLRAELTANLKAEIVYAPLALCTDNGAMIAHAGALRMLGGAEENLSIEHATTIRR